MSSVPSNRADPRPAGVDGRPVRYDRPIPVGSGAVLAQQINRVCAVVLVLLSLAALLTVVSGYVRPPQPDDVREHIFQLAIVALLPMLLVFFASADRERPFRSLRLLAVPAAASVTAFAALYVLEHYR